MKEITSESPSTRDKISLPERRWVLVFAIIVMLVTTIPYWLGYSNQGDNHVFTGFVFGADDGNSYIAKMLNGTFGAWLFRTPYTAYEQRGAFMYLPYLILGKLASPPGLHEQLVVLYHLFRFISGVLVILAAYDFLAFFLAGVRLRRLGVGLCVLGGGLGWVLVLLGRETWLGSLPLEFYSPETFGFLGIYGLPHVALARALMLWAFLVYLCVVEHGLDGRVWIKGVLKVGLLWLFAGLLQPLVALIIGFVLVLHISGLGIWLFWQKSRQQAVNWANWWGLVRFVVIAGIMPGIFVLYQVWALISDPFLQAWTSQNVLESPHPAHYLLAYGLLLPFAWFGGRRLLRRNVWTGWLLVGWTLSMPVLAYAPVGVQRRLPEGIWVVLVVLALSAFEKEAQVGEDAQDGGKFSDRLKLAPFFLAFPATVFLLLGGVLATNRLEMPLYRPVDEVVIFQYLMEQAEPDEIVLTDFYTGNALPAWAPLRVVIGHGPESANLSEIEPQVKKFYASQTSDEYRQGFIQEFGVRYVFWGPAERALGDWNPGMADYLELFQEAGEYAVYVVKTSVLSDGDNE